MEIADEIEQQILPELADAIVAAEVRGDFGPHACVQNKLKDIARRSRQVARQIDLFLEDGDRNRLIVARAQSLT